MSTHTADMLKLLQQLPLEIKIEKTKQRIIEWYEHYQGQVYISFSGGKEDPNDFKLDGFWINARRKNRARRWIKWTKKLVLQLHLK